jgi:hypothetical protein
MIDHLFKLVSSASIMGMKDLNQNLSLGEGVSSALGASPHTISFSCYLPCIYAFVVYIRQFFFCFMFSVVESFSGFFQEVEEGFKKFGTYTKG